MQRFLNINCYKSEVKEITGTSNFFKIILIKLYNYFLKNMSIKYF